MELKDTFVGRAMGTDYFRTHKTEAYVEIPPAMIITDERGDVWTLGLNYNQAMEFDVVRNDCSTGEFASRIVYRGGKVKIFGKAGWKTWNGRGLV